MSATCTISSYAPAPISYNTFPKRDIVKYLSPKHQWILLSGNEEKNIPHYNHSEIQPIPGIPKVRVRIENKSSGDDFKKHFRCVNKSKYVSEKN